MKLSVFCSLALLGSMATVVDARAQSPAPALTIYWAGAQMSPSGEYSEVTSTRLVVRAKDELRFYFSAATACYLYVLHSDTQGSLSLLYPEPSGIGKLLAPGAQQYLPRRDVGFKVDARKGREMIFVLVSAERLTGVERLWSDYQTSPASARQAASKSVVEEIARLRKKYEQPETTDAKPVLMAGKFRGVPDLRVMAREMNATGFLARTYILEHK